MLQFCGGYGILITIYGKEGTYMAQMTKMQQKIYDYIARTLKEQGYPPSVR